MSDDQEIICPKSARQEMMVNIDADFIVAGGSVGSSKTYSALMRSLRYIDDPNYKAVYFRRETTQLRGQGGLWQEAKQLYTRFGGVPKEKDLAIVFPSGAEIRFHHMEHEKNAEDHSGLQYSAIFFDEAQYFTEFQVIFLMSRLRSKSKNKSFMFLTCNPNPDHFLLKWVEWYLLENGRADPDKVGKIRYYVMKDGNPIFSDNQQDLIDQYPEICYVAVPDSEEKMLVPPKSFSFVGATIWDNPVLMRNKPEYVAELNSLPPVEKERLLYGSWYARALGSNYFQREWLIKTDKVPIDAVCCRAWDKASEEPSDKNRSPDYTACSPKMWKDRDGFYYMTWDVNSEIKEEKSNITGQFRKRPGERDLLILKQAKHDGTDCHVVFATDPGASGKVEYQESSKKLVVEGFVVKPDPMPNNKSKLKRFEPFSSACQNGLVRIVESSFPNKETLENFYKNLEAFTGGESTRTYHDDIVDATASAFNYINKRQNVRIVRRNQQSHSTISKDLLNEFRNN